jgi:uncharacterized membrane protein YgcG
MKKIWIWTILAVVVIGAAAWYLFFRKNAPLARNTVATTGTQKPIMAWFPGWTGFNEQSLQATTSTVTAAFDALKNIANNFGVNDGGNSNGVSISGSGSGGTQSSGSGAGVPYDSSDEWDTGSDF